MERNRCPSFVVYARICQDIAGSIQYISNRTFKFFIRNKRLGLVRKTRPVTLDILRDTTSSLNREFLQRQYKQIDYIPSRNKIRLCGHVRNKPQLTTLKTGERATQVYLEVVSYELPMDQLRNNTVENRKFPDNFVLEFFERVAYMVVQKVEQGCKIKVTGQLGTGSKFNNFSKDTAGKPVLTCSSFVVLEPNEEEFRIRKEPLVVLRKPGELCEPSILFPEESEKPPSSLQNNRTNDIEQDRDQKQDNFQDILNNKDWSLLDNIF